jgi:hypothetical protein
VIQKGDAGPPGPAPRPVDRPELDAEPPPVGCWVTFTPCGCRQHLPYMPGIIEALARRPRAGVWITHHGPHRQQPTACQASGRVTGVEPCAEARCPYCAADRVAYHRRQFEYPRTDPSPDRPVYTPPRTP